MRILLKDRYIQMGLEGNPEKGLYSYSDQYAKVVYRQLTTLPGEEDNLHLTDSTQLPLLAIFTKHPDDENDDYTYCGVLSDLYQFLGYDVLNQRIRNSIQEIGNPNIVENAIMKDNCTLLRNEFIIQSSQQNTPEIGDVFPVIITENSYNGSRSASLTFGISTQVNSTRIVFSFNLGKIKQTHIVNASSEMTTTVSSYIDIFSNNIVDLIEDNFNNVVTEDQMFNMLDIVEKLGKNRRNEVSKLLTEINPSNDGNLPTSWQLFLSIVRYSSFEPNLNIKRMLENAAESVLVIPTRMYNVLDQLQKQESE